MMGKFASQMSAWLSYKSRPESQKSNPKMKLFVFSFVCAFLQVSHQNPASQWTMKPHVLVVVVDGSLGQQSLSCLERPEELPRRDNKDEDISWRKNGVEEAQRGNAYLLELEESFAGGNYTCHSKDGSLLNHTEVLIQDDETNRRRILVKADQGDYLDCSTQNYNGEFQCSWTWHPRRVSKVAFIKARRLSDDNDIQCSVDESGQRWTCSSGQSNFGCSVDESGNRILCLDQQHCPYAEESQQIHVTVYVKTAHFLVENYSKYLYLSEIVKPDKVTISKVNTTMIEWSYPSSWNSPYSYFPLTFQIAQFRGRRKRCDNQCTDPKATKTSTVHSTCQFEVKRWAKAVCIRAKDALCNSQWSDWSFLSLRSRKKNKGRKKPNLTVEK
ncbi:interleukin 12Ba precursor [Anarrhichthys ocellatus]|uniref:interleukin 12Ba precursor n=1 Tax=Anarrhichthys ocellatus TaxID=433405 RepID=UPI0012ED5FFB|nr:interleukin-12 subunit beta-like [Anarrhichthys ocellatus]